MNTTFTHFIVGQTETNTIRIIEKIGNHIKELKQYICVEELILNKINENPEFTSLTFDVEVNNDTYIFRIHRFFLSTWYDGYIEKRKNDSDDKRSRYILDNWKNGLLNNEFSLSYQPIMNVKNNSCTNVEALLRWTHQEKSISPAEFIPVIEENQQLMELEIWVIEEVLKQMADWQKANIQLNVHINISIQTLQEISFFNRFREIAANYPVSSENIIFEITERSTITLTESLLSNMSQLAELGVKFAIDDFGAGSTSFSYITELPISIIKIDKQFLKNEENTSVLNAIINALNTLNMTIVAEGIETNTMMMQMVNKDVQFIQGYYYAKPITPKELLSFIKVKSKKKVYFKNEKAKNKNHFSKIKEQSLKYRIM
ncbi:MAG: EAL domain-containing protein [Lysinibacillus sp.]